MKELPSAFVERVRRTLSCEPEFQEFIKSYEQPPFRGLHFNLCKARPETIEFLVRQWGLKKVPWSPCGWYYDEATGIFPGRSPYHDAGVYYIQEPSAMAVAEQAQIRPGDRVLDLCAAPGGKSARAAALCRGSAGGQKGLLVSNEIIPKRARILSSNIERLGFDHCVVTQAAPEELSACLDAFFDRIIVDAPCSGEGMMRRDEIAVSEWSEEQVAVCAERQRGILMEAWRMLRPGGTLVYSTCTFEPSENAEMVTDFAEAHKDAGLEGMHQLWPHREQGEGHFYAVLKKQDREETETGIPSDREGLTAYLKKKKIHVLRSGIEKGELIVGQHEKKPRYEPSHAEAMAVTKESGPESEYVKPYVTLRDEAAAFRYLSGAQLCFGPDLSGEEQERVPDGFVRVLFDGYPLGLGKKKGAAVKNHLPKGLRRP